MCLVSSQSYSSAFFVKLFLKKLKDWINIEGRISREGCSNIWNSQCVVCVEIETSLGLNAWATPTLSMYVMWLVI